MAEQQSLKCRYCPETLPNVTQLKKHVRSEHNNISRRAPRAQQKVCVGTSTCRDVDPGDDRQGYVADHRFDPNDDDQDRRDRMHRQEPIFSRER